MTKKEIKILEEERQMKASKRRKMMSDLESYWLDVEAVKRVALINKETDKLDYRNDLKQEESQKLLNRYEDIKDLSTNQKTILRTLINNRNYSKWFKEILPKDAIAWDDIIWKEEDLIEYVEFLKELGITHMYYTNASTGCLDVMVWLTRVGAKIVGTTNILEYREGLIIEL